MPIEITTGSKMNKIRKSLGLLFPAMKISVALALLSACILLTADMLGYTIDEDAMALENRKQIAESLAIQFSVIEPSKDVDKIEKMIELITQRNPAILSAGIRHFSGQIIFQSPGHIKLWEGYEKGNSTSSHILVPLFDRDRLWGNVELRFGELYGHTLIGFSRTEVFRLMVFSTLVGFFVYLVFMLRTLRQIDPSAVIPGRVNAAFDTLSEGVMILDESEQILLTNKAFAERIGRDPAILMSTKASEMKWKKVSRRKSNAILPWVEALASGSAVIGAQFDLVTDGGETIKYAINASPILNSDGTAQGVLVTLDDITMVEEQNVQLKTMVHRLEETQVMVKQQNKELTYLATRDALTGCLNRRAFSDGFKLMFDESREKGTELSCVMVDLDHFKPVNDNFGHAVGDEVIIMLAEVLKANTRKEDLVGRYGGEEFCVVLPGMSLERPVRSPREFVCASRTNPTNVTKTAPESPPVSASPACSTIRKIRAHSTSSRTKRSTAPRKTGATASSATLRSPRSNPAPKDHWTQLIRSRPQTGRRSKACRIESPNSKISQHSFPQSLTTPRVMTNSPAYRTRRYSTIAYNRVSNAVPALTNFPRCVSSISKCSARSMPASVAQVAMSC